MNLAEIFETLLGKELQIRFTAYDGSSAGPPVASSDTDGVGAGDSAIGSVGRIAGSWGFTL